MLIVIISLAFNIYERNLDYIIGGERNVFTEKINEKKYISKDPEECRLIQSLCIEGMKPFFNEQGCGCESIREDKQKIFCKPESRNVDVCIENFKKVEKLKFSKKNFDAISFGNVNYSKFSIEIYQPVCGWFDPETIQCIKYPCVETLSNSCVTCMNVNVLYYTEGECPR